MVSSKQKEQFEQRITLYVVQLLKFLKSLPKDRVTNEIVSQAVRSGSSIGANYFEARGGSPVKDFQNFFGHALKSANETRFWLRILDDADLIPAVLRKDAVRLYDETQELANIMAASIMTMKKGASKKS